MNAAHVFAASEAIAFYVLYVRIADLFVTFELLVEFICIFHYYSPLLFILKNCIPII